jgi:hypothetical protein
MTMLHKFLVSASALVLLGAAAVRAEPTLEEGFQNPPQSARPRVWWHWMNGNITEDGIAKDMAWMKRVGIGGLQNFDANLITPQVVQKRLVYMTPEWKHAFKFAATEAERQGLELTIASSPGWSETGGPWVPPEDGLKKLVWSETVMTGGAPFTGKLAAPPSTTGPFQNLKMAASIDELMSGGISGEKKDRPRHYADVAVLAVPVLPQSFLSEPRVSSSDGPVLNADLLSDGDLNSAVDLKPGSKSAPATLSLDYGARQTIRSASLFLPGAAAMFFGATVNPRLEASDDGTAWRTVVEMPAAQVPTTVSFAPVTARHFRLVFAPSSSNPLEMMGAGAPGVDLASLGGGLATAPKPVIHVGEFKLSGAARIDRYETKAGFETALDYYALSKGVPNEVGADPSRVVNLTSKMRADGSLDWTPPKGMWRVLRLGYSLLGTENHPATKEATGLEVDKFDGSAVRRYIEHYIGMYKDAAGPENIGKQGVRAILTDSIEVGAANWTPKMVEQFRTLRGYDPTPWLPALTGVIIKSRAASDNFLYDFRRTIADLMASEHYGTVAKVAHENGLRVYGEALEDHRPSLGDDMAMRSHTDIPMSALWTYNRKAGPRFSYLVDMRGAASVAHLYGQNLVAAESMTASMSPWAFAPADLRRVIDLEFASGVNRPVVHTSVHQPVDDKVPGLSLFIFGQYFNRHETWAEMARPWVDYMARNAYMLQQGRFNADVAYFYGEEAPLTGLYGDKAVPDAPKHYGYDFVNPDVVNNLLSVEGGDLVATSGARYKVLYLGGSSNKMSVPMLRRLVALTSAGATIVGNAPTASPSQADDPGEFKALVARLWGGGLVGKGKVIAGTDVEAALASIGATPDFRTNAAAGSEILFVHRKLADGDAYFVDNRKDRVEKLEARFRITGKTPELWHADTGKSEAVSYKIERDETAVQLELGADESGFIVFRKAATAASATVTKPDWADAGTIDGAWAVTFQPGRGAPASATLTKAQSLTENADAGIKYFSGTSAWTSSFSAPNGWAKGAPLMLDLGKVGDVAEVRINGVMVGTVWHAPYAFDIGAAAKSGENMIEVRVANLWVNRIIGDSQKGASKVTYYTGPGYVPNAPLRPAGLIGPVMLKLAK